MIHSRRTTFLEKWGSGAKRMIELCREQSVSEPEWIIKNGSVKIVFRRRLRVSESRVKFV